MKKKRIAITGLVTVLVLTTGLTVSASGVMGLNRATTSQGIMNTQQGSMSLEKSFNFNDAVDEDIIDDDALDDILDYLDELQEELEEDTEDLTREEAREYIKENKLDIVELLDALEDEDILSDDQVDDIEALIEEAEDASEEETSVGRANSHDPLSIFEDAEEDDLIDEDTLEDIESYFEDIEENIEEDTEDMTHEEVREYMEDNCMDLDDLLDDLMDGGILTDDEAEDIEDLADDNETTTIEVPAQQNGYQQGGSQQRINTFTQQRR